MLEATERVDCFQATDKFKGWNASLFSLSLPLPPSISPREGGESIHTQKKRPLGKKNILKFPLVCVCVRVVVEDQ